MNDSPNSKSKCKVLIMSDVKAQKLEWLWLNTIPFGKLTLFYGDGENAKSLTTIDIAARGSQGLPMARETTVGAPFSTIIVTTEDSASDIMKPRLEVAKADCSKIALVTDIVFDDGSEGPFHAANSIRELCELIDQLGDVKLIVIDPLTEFLGNTNLWSEAEVRQALAPLKKLAKEKNLAVVLICHLNKGDGNAKQRATGSTAIVNTCRAAWLFVEDEDDHEKYLMLRAKGNPMKRTRITGRAFHLDDVPFFGDGPDDGVPRINWSDEPVYITANEALRQQKQYQQPRNETTGKKDIAMVWIQRTLANERIATKQFNYLAEQAGIRDSTLYKAMKSLGVTQNELGQYELPSSSKAA